MEGVDLLTNAPEVVLDLEFKAICKSVTARSCATSELLRGTSINGTPVIPGGQFGDRGDRILTSNKSTWEDDCIDARAFGKAFRDTQGCLVVSTWGEIVPDKEDQVIFAIAGRQENLSSGTHRWNSTPYYLYLEIPKDNAIRLIEIFKYRPELIENFYQENYKGFDSQPGEEVGLRRIKTDKLKIINIKDENPLKSAVELNLPEKIGVVD